MLVGGGGVTQGKSTNGSTYTFASLTLITSPPHTHPSVPPPPRPELAHHLMLQRQGLTNVPFPCRCPNLVDATHGSGVCAECEEAVESQKLHDLRKGGLSPTATAAPPSPEHHRLTAPPLPTPFLFPNPQSQASSWTPSTSPTHSPAPSATVLRQLYRNDSPQRLALSNGPSASGGSQQSPKQPAPLGKRGANTPHAIQVPPVAGEHGRSPNVAGRWLEDPPSASEPSPNSQLFRKTVVRPSRAPLALPLSLRSFLSSFDPLHPCLCSPPPPPLPSTYSQQYQPAHSLSRYGTPAPSSR